jgi:hypothetical protein
MSIDRVSGSAGDVRTVSIPEAGLVAMYCTARRNMATCRVFWINNRGLAERA